MVRPRQLRREAALDFDELREFARVIVRSGYLDADSARAEIAEAARDDHGVADAAGAAEDLVASELAELRRESADWPAMTDYDRFTEALEELRTRGIVTLPYVDDHWAATAELERRDELGERVAGVAWFTPPDVWHAVRHGMLELNLWHGDSANVAPGDDLLDEVLEVLHRHGLAAHFDEGRIEVAVRWQRR